MSETVIQSPRSERAFVALLYAATLVAWGTSWYALKINAASGVPIEVSVFYRFVIAAVVMVVFLLVRRGDVILPTKLHPRLAFTGVAIFSMNFVLYYYASRTVPSGILAVCFSLVSVMNVLVASVVDRKPADKRTLIAAFCGVFGLCAVFWPEIAGQTFDRAALLALGLCITGNVLFCAGNFVSAGLQKRGVSVVRANAHGMFYGALAVGLVALIKGQDFSFSFEPAFLVSLGWLSIVSTVIAFAAYLTLLGRIGPGRAGTLTIAFPIVALFISTVAEGYQWTILAACGAALVVMGNALTLRLPGKAQDPHPQQGS
ncbi:MAG: DMT family transporter [Pseudomonadota bacterium]